jgi:hypothetical protein
MYKLTQSVENLKEKTDLPLEEENFPAFGLEFNIKFSLDLQSDSLPCDFGLSVLTDMSQLIKYYVSSASVLCQDLC